MACIYMPRKRVDDRFDMTVASDEEGWCRPIGYCAGWQEPDPVFLRTQLDENTVAMFLHDIEKRRLHVDKYHDKGHATPNDAQACYNNYRLDNDLDYREEQNVMRECAVCKEFTKLRAVVGRSGVLHEVYLCLRHATRAGVAYALKWTQIVDGGG